ncbi:MAG: hypothetical protein BGO03_03285 [Mesorhizobium sp. 61-13]|nr:MAG: hypothetical protein BGO03_03285 [Mesorhizobium sp. 61-13]
MQAKSLDADAWQGGIIRVELFQPISDRLPKPCPCRRCQCQGLAAGAQALQIEAVRHGIGLLGQKREVTLEVVNVDNVGGAFQQLRQYFFWGIGQICL